MDVSELLALCQSEMAALDALQHTLAGRGVHRGFMHLPLLPEQAAQWPGPTLPSWPAAVQVAGVQQALALLVAHRQHGLGDAAISGGTLN